MIKIVHTEIQGTSHIANDIPCQDKTMYICNDLYSCVALADGAGSCRFSHIGAQIAVEYVCNYFKCNQFVNISEFLEGLKNSLIESGYPLNTLSSTLLFAHIIDNRVTIGHIGDGVIIAFDKGKPYVLSYPENGNESNITFFTTDKNVHQHFRLKSLEFPRNNEMSIFLMSDGGAELFYNKETNSVANALNTISYWLKEENVNEINEALFVNLSEIAKVSTNDDVSIIGIRKAPTNTINE